MRGRESKRAGAHRARPWRPLVLAALLAACGDGSGVDEFHARLLGIEEVPANDSALVMGARLRVVRADRIDYATDLVPLPASDVLAAHVHSGAPGVVGPVIFTMDRRPVNGAGIGDGRAGGLGGAGGGGGGVGGSLVSFEGSWTATDLVPDPAGGILTFDDALDAIRGGRAYVNLHTTRVPTGEVRGSIVPGKGPDGGTADEPGPTFDPAMPTPAPNATPVGEDPRPTFALLTATPHPHATPVGDLDGLSAAVGLAPPGRP